MEEEKLTPKQRRLSGLRPAQKGQVLNPQGKKPGTLNRINQETKEFLAYHPLKASEIIMIAEANIESDE